MFADVFSGVALCSPSCIAAQAKGWRRGALKGRTYPGAIPDENGAIDGILWLDVPKAALDRLDKFEGNEYARIEITIHSSEGRVYRGGLYRWLLPDELEGEWSVEAFDRSHRGSFVAIHGTK